MNNYSKLEILENESIFIIREAIAELNNPVFLYSIGKDSSVLLRLIQKAFYPSEIPLDILHIDTGYKFPEMIDFRNKIESQLKLKIKVINSDLDPEQINPYTLGTNKCCSLLKTQQLISTLKNNNYDGAIGGARREEEQSRSKERIFSIRSNEGKWDPLNQRPELWNLYNTKLNTNESLRIFPLSNWTEIDIWNYINIEKIPIVPLYYAKKRQVIVENGIILPYIETNNLVLDKSMNKLKIKEMNCRFRTLGCWPCSGAIESNANTIEQIIEETQNFKNSERQNRIIDHDSNYSMEEKKRQGYF